jgi:hypothetical protein
MKSAGRNLWLAASLCRPALSSLEFQTLTERAVGPDCVVPCGFYKQLCCAANQVCYTDVNRQAQCSSTAVTTLTALVIISTRSTLATTVTTYTAQTDTITSGDLNTPTSTAIVTATTTITTAGPESSAEPSQDRSAEWPPWKIGSVATGGIVGLALAVLVCACLCCGLGKNCFRRRRVDTEVPVQTSEYPATLDSERAREDQRQRRSALMQENNVFVARQDENPVVAHIQARQATSSDLGKRP